tara:strand:- start:72 stop:446 length:375 start_codon:yes stop_codon:yes gene_type:complete
MKDDRGDLDLTKQIEVLRKKVHDAELETSLVKAVGMNSPEMKQAKADVKESQDRLAECLEIDRSHQTLNGKLHMKINELEETNLKLRREITNKEQEILEIHADNVKLALQVDDKVAALRKAGVI